MALRPLRLLGASLALVLSACSVELQHDLTEDDANDIYVLLQRKGIEAKKLKEELSKDELTSGKPSGLPSATRRKPDGGSTDPGVGGAGSSA